MSGHSKWATIKRAKAATDAKKGTLFTKLAKNISVAAKNGKDPVFNPSLRVAIDKAREFNMLKDKIEKAILRGAGELPGQQFEEITYEGYGPGGVAILIETVTDNKNRTSSEIKSLLTKHGGNLAAKGSVAYIFSKKGVLHLEEKSEEAQLKAIDMNALDVLEEEGGLTIYTKPEDLEKFKKEFSKNSYAEVEQVPANKVDVADRTKIEKLLDELENNEDVNNYYSNANLQ